MYKVELKLFGIFRKNIPTDHISFVLKQDTNLADFRKILGKEFLKNDEIDKYEASNDSVFANEKEILSDHFMIDRDICLAILPPVCGG